MRMEVGNLSKTTTRPNMLCWLTTIKSDKKKPNKNVDDSLTTSYKCI